MLEHTSTPAATGEPGPGRPGRLPRWFPHGDRATAARALVRREWLAGAFGGSAVFALVTALTSSNAPERVWGVFAAVSYAVAAVTAAVVRRRRVSLAALISLAGAVAAPLAWMAVTGMAQPEVAVIIRSAAMLVHQGTPYASPAALAAAHSWRAYDPYLPALIVFGVPRAYVGGLFSDPRIWFGVVFEATFGAAVRIARIPRPVWWTVLVTASPVVALPLAVGGDDLPVLGLMCLGLALASRGSRSQWRWAAAAGLALGLATAMKATAWPAVAVLAVLLVARQGWRAVTWFAAAVLGVAVAIDGPAVVAQPAATLANTVLYPLGLAKVASPAASSAARSPACEYRGRGPLDRAGADGAGRGGSWRVVDRPPAQGRVRGGLAADARAGPAVRACARQPGRLFRVPAGAGRLAAAVALAGTAR